MKAGESLITQAIANKSLIHFNYEGHSRCVEPHHYGLLNNTKQLHAYQISNGSNCGHIPEWRNFKLDLITHLSIDKKAHFLPRQSYNPVNSHYSLIIKSVQIAI